MTILFKLGLFVEFSIKSRKTQMLFTSIMRLLTLCPVNKNEIHNNNNTLKSTYFSLFYQKNGQHSKINLTKIPTGRTWLQETIFHYKIVQYLHQRNVLDFYENVKTKPSSHIPNKFNKIPKTGKMTLYVF